MKKVLFICTGNYYRSRYAEILFNHYAEGLKLPWEAISRGTRTKDNGNIGPISPYTLHRLAQKNFKTVDISRYPIQLSAYDLVEANLAFAFKESEHRKHIDTSFPLLAHKVKYWNIHDIDVEKPDQALGKIDALLEELFITLQ